MPEGVEACLPDTELHEQRLEDASADVVAGDRRTR
jgi:hypothetical protein